VLIGPRTDAPSGAKVKPLTLPGDSGTLWFYDPPALAKGGDVVGGGDDDDPVDFGARAPRLRPVAMQWAGQRTHLPDGTRSAYALGTFLSTVSRALDVEVVRNWSTGHDEYWGKIGHFAIGFKACDQVTGALGTLMRANQQFIGAGDDRLKEGSEFRVDRKGFVPLADVPDYVWINTRPNEPIQHFADVDIQDIDGGPSLLQRCHADSSQIAASVWKAYFDGFASKGVGPEEGCLPFRVWEIWDAMVGYLKKKDVLRFVCAAGVLAHYVGDASQPLHCSYLHHGVPPMKTVSGRKYPVPRDSAEFLAFKKTRAAKIHGIYEETMLEVDPAAALSDVDALLSGSLGTSVNATSGHDAAAATVELMFDAQSRLKPKAIIDADDPSKSPKARAAPCGRRPRSAKRRFFRSQRASASSRISGNRRGRRATATHCRRPSSWRSWTRTSITCTGTILSSCRA